MFECYQGRKVLVTGHTGFKGSWLCEWLLSLGAEVYGFSNGIPTRPSLFLQLRLSKRIKKDIRGDIRDRAAVRAVVESIKPDFVFHLAAQPLVRLSYEQPVETFDTNVMGTINVLDALRVVYTNSKFQIPNSSLPHCSAVLITTDKCYENKETMRPYKEDDPMGGYDPYSCSKGCDELVISSYRRSFFNTPDSPVWIASARAGNVIGGGDWAKDRIVPDCMRALDRGEAILVRNKTSTRPWQHVLEPLCGYLTLGAALDARKDFSTIASGFNFGPDPKSNRTVKDLVVEILKHRDGKWEDQSNPKAVHEAGLLNLNIAKAKKILAWKPHWKFERTIAETASWYSAVSKGLSAKSVTQSQIAAYMQS